MDTRGTTRNDFQCYTAELAKAYPFATCLIRRADGYCVQFLVQSECKVQHIPTGKQTGIDPGLKAFLTDAEGNTVANPRHLRKAEKKLKRLHRRLSRTQKHSANRKKARKKLASGKQARWQGERRIPRDFPGKCQILIKCAHQQYRRQQER
jgi:transposase